MRIAGVGLAAERYVGARNWLSPWVRIIAIYEDSSTKYRRIAVDVDVEESPRTWIWDSPRVF